MARSPTTRRAPRLRDERHLDLIREFDLTSGMTVPMRAGGRTLGALTFGTTGNRAVFTEKDFDLAKEIARRTALAVDNARLYSEAQRAIRSREDFLSIASHELKTPLTALQFQIQTLLRASEKGALQTMPVERATKMLHGAVRQGKRLARLSETLLDISRIDAGRLELNLADMDLSQLAVEVVDRLSDEAARGGCDFDLRASRTVEGKWDRLRLDQVTTNLLSNAIKYGAGKRIKLSIKHEDSYAMIEVVDQGIGIEPAHLARVFDRFERASSARHYGGLGLGLYITRQIVEAHAGSISVVSSPGNGSIFTVKLPLTA